MPKQLLLFLLLFLITGCSSGRMQDQNKHEYTNRLVNESSPYLLQHAHNPVDWQPWDKEALNQAKEEDKLMIISVGYAACHWCHVMEHESFEDSTVASLMNENFVSIKVDREERPDVDNIYMMAAYMTNGRGGWPLNAIALPDGRPVFGGTYYPKDQWMKILDYFINAWKNDKEKLLDDAAKLEQGLKGNNVVLFNENELNVSDDYLNDVFKKWTEDIDFEGGGSARAPKFPMPTNWEYLMDYAYLKNNSKAKEAVLVTLDNMAMGGIYDHLGGGFARYSTDAIWLVPHFEKMLYDNGQLVSLYSKAYTFEQKQLYKDVVYETLEWVEREMTNDEGGFYSSLDADSEGEEGKFYVWSLEEVEGLLGEDTKAFVKHYAVSERGNFEEHNIFVEPLDEIASAKSLSISVEELRALIKRSKMKLMAEREKRIRPGTDDKVLTGWNALMLKGYVDAYTTFGEQKFLDAALKNAEFISKKCTHDNSRLTRTYKNGKATINAFIEDYALVADAFIQLYQATFDEKWLYKAEEYVKYAQDHFYDDQSKGFFFTSDEDDPLIVRDQDWNDNVIPCGNSVMAENLIKLGTLLYKQAYIDAGKQMLNNVIEDIKRQPRFFSNWLQVATMTNFAPYEIAVVGNDYKKLRLDLGKEFIPNAIFLGGKNEGSLDLLKMKLQDGQTTIYVCQNKVCKFPVTEVSDALPLINYK